MEHLNNSLTGEGIELSFGGIKVLQGLDVEFRSGEITGLIGPNGAGKTSLFNCMTGAYSPQKGRISFGNQSLDGLPPAARANLGVVRSFQHVALCPDLSVLENVMIGIARNYHLNWFHAFLPTPAATKEKSEMKAAAKQALASLGLSAFENDMPTELPPGTLRLVEIARAIVGNPSVLMLDEPAAGLNNSETNDLIEVLNKIKSPELVMVVVEHDMDLVMSICDSIYVLNFGQFVTHGTPEQVRNNSDVIEIYLGKEDE